MRLSKSACLIWSKHATRMQVIMFSYTVLTCKGCALFYSVSKQGSAAIVHECPFFAELAVVHLFHAVMVCKVWERHALMVLCIGEHARSAVRCLCHNECCSPSIQGLHAWPPSTMQLPPLCRATSCDEMRRFEPPRRLGEMLFSQNLLKSSRQSLSACSLLQ